MESLHDSAKNPTQFSKQYKTMEKVHVMPKIPSIGKYWNILGILLLPKNVILLSLESASDIQKYPILIYRYPKL